MRIPIIIPAYEPDERFIKLLSELKEDNYIVVVDDGSGPDYKVIFSRADRIIKDRGILLRHEVNRGKGRALKTAFEYVLDNMPDAIGVVTADSDGQHTKDCISTVRGSLKEHPDSLVLGVRTFSGEAEIPWKSRFGNTLTQRVMKMVTGIAIGDTQTGLRGIPRQFMKELLDVKGERFEFETHMLLEAVDEYDILEVPIKTIYESSENHQTHFNPFFDSVKIYKILLGRFIRYVFSALSSFVIDIVLFTLLCAVLKNWNGVLYAAVSTALARVISAIYNYMMNYGFVFKSREKRSVSAGKYLTLAVMQMGCSAALVTGAIFVFSNANEAILKMIIDTMLFFVSYQIQKRYVF